MKPIHSIWIVAMTLAICGCSQSAPLKHVETADEIRAWEGYYKATYNIRYREIDGDDGLLADWKAITARYKAQYDADKPDPKELDALFIAVDAIEHKETPIKLEVAHKAQGDVNEKFFGKRTYDEIVAAKDK